MGDDAKSTYIADPDEAISALAAMSARAEVMGDRVKALTSRIAALEAGKPWGTTQEYGGKFEAVYNAGGQGADFIRENVHVLSETTDKGARSAHQAVFNSSDIDDEGANLFKVPGSTTGADSVASAATSAAQRQSQS